MTAHQALQNTITLAQHAERLGYHRFWVSEHHNSDSLAGSSPEILISAIASKTERIRVGSGGVMLPHYSAYKVAENFALLQTMFPDRIDLGLGRAPGGMPLATMALQENSSRDIRDYPNQIDDLIDYLHNNTDDHRFQGLKATPVPENAPEMWLLGSSGSSAAVAAEKGAGFSFAHFINPVGGPQVMQSYRENFKPSIIGQQPAASVAIFAVCAETEEKAEALASSLDLSILLIETGRSRDGIPSVEQAAAFPYTPYDREHIAHNRGRMVVGTPDSVKKQLEQLAAAYGTDEIIIVSIIHDFEAKLQSYKLIAEAFKN
ncbi:LLM class flavin-dependent oxidoreductase [Fictibacillus aquaticus]|uniref:LLM class flavin-dependent oxidoreductase n=2 Tax=Fictibacillus aquaticus TaxID=2021314 RepID=A0A235FEP9_9BACL|nr:LLM class flavin-dependent oxidoreductase [Fictibacillus aquaticus]